MVVGRSKGNSGLSVRPSSMPKCMLASRLLSITGAVTEFLLAPWLLSALLTQPLPKLLQLMAPLPQLLLPLDPCFFSCPLPWAPSLALSFVHFLFLSCPPPFPTSLDQVPSAHQVQVTLSALDSSRCPWQFFLISTVKTFPSVTPRRGHILTLYIWCPNPQFLR